MEASFIYEIIGYIASVLVAVSLMMSKIVKLRVVNMIGAAIFSLYGVLIGSIPVAGMNGFIVLINVYYLYKIYTNEEYFTLLRVSYDSEYLMKFLNFYKSQIDESQPNFQYEPVENGCNIFVLRDMVPAGVLIGREENENELHVDLDFVIPSYRDFKIGRFLFSDNIDFFRDHGVETVVARGGDKEHQTYLKEMNFEKDFSKEDVYKLQLT